MSTLVVEFFDDTSGYVTDLDDSLFFETTGFDLKVLFPVKRLLGGLRIMSNLPEDYILYVHLHDLV